MTPHRVRDLFLALADSYARAASSRVIVTWVYFVRAGDDGPVKVGTTSSVEHRLVELQTGNHTELCLLRAIPGDMLTERLLHEFLAEERVRGEWFAWCRKLELLLELFAELDGEHAAAHKALASFAGRLVRE